MSDLPIGSDTSPTVVPEQPMLTAAEFYETVPPNVLTRVAKLPVVSNPSKGPEVAMPVLQLHCSSEQCNGLRFFDGYCDRPYLTTSTTYHFVVYTCRNCQKCRKVYAISARITHDLYNGEARKIGEWPPFGLPIPSRVISLIGPDRELFLSGYRSENQGLGIGAFSYYRRVVENRKDRLIDEIIKVAKTVHEEHTISALRSARDEQQFSKAMDLVKDAIPQALLINRHNPLTLLHSALSEGLHAQDDDQCLELATSIRVVLTELAERMSVALKNNAEIKAAVSRLFKGKQPSKKPLDR
jgi:hypothetical protein